MPIESLSGTMPGGKNEILYKRRKIQISRTWSEPDNTNNTHYNTSHEISLLNIEEWQNLSDANKRLWIEFAFEWNRSGQLGKLHYNAYTSFLAVNYYQRVLFDSFISTPPIIPQIKKWKISAASPWNPDLEGSIIKYESHHDFNPNEHLLIKTFKPRLTNDPPSNKTEPAMINGISPDSFGLMFPESYETHILGRKYAKLYILDQYVTFRTRIIHIDGFPNVYYQHTIKIKESGMIYSDGSLTQWFAAVASGGPLSQSNPGLIGWFYSDDSGDRKLQTKITGSKCNFTIPYRHGSLLTSLSVRIKSPNTNNKIKLRLIKHKPALDAAYWEVVKEEEFALVATMQTITLIFSPDEQLLEDYSYHLEVESYNVGYTFLELYAWAIRTSLRVL